MDYLEEAKGIMEGAFNAGGVKVDQVELARVFVAIAQAEQTKRIADKLDEVTGWHNGEVYLRTVEMEWD